MSVGLFLRCAVLGFAVVVAATVAILSGPLACGLSFVTFLLGLVASELYHTRASPVESNASREEDSAFMALFEAQPEARTVAGAEPAPPPPPPAPPKRNFRCTSDAMAIGSTAERTQLASRHALHRAGVRRAPTSVQAPEEALFEALPEPTTEVAPVVETSLAGGEGEPGPAASASAPERTVNRDPPPPKVTIFRAA